MKCIALERELPGATPEDFAMYGEEEALQVWNLIQQDKIREIFFHKDKNDAVIILECKDEKEAGEILDNLPFVIKGLTEFEVIPLKPYPGLERLIKNTGSKK